MLPPAAGESRDGDPPESPVRKLVELLGEFRRKTTQSPGGGMRESVRVLVSACLLGQKVRYDGGHKRSAFLVETLGKRVQWIPVCPEVESGLPTPREPMLLAGDPESPRLVAATSGIDHTERVLRWARERVRELASLDLRGYVCKGNSPSCSGRGRIEVFGDASGPARAGTGLFTMAFMERFPLVPVEEEERLRDRVLREIFLEKVFTLRQRNR
jgi:uncharacterized protein YbbK (DUF523 family)